MLINARFRRSAGTQAKAAVTHKDLRYHQQFLA